MPEPAVTVLMPVYNGTDYLREAIDSVRAQTVPDWRVLAVDDASTDDSPRLLREAASGDPRVTVACRSDNRGLYGTLAGAIDDVETEWVTILMQDDRLDPVYLAEMARLRGQFPEVDGFWATEHLIDRTGAVIASGTDTGRIEIIAPGVAAWRHALERGCLWTISGSMTRKRLLQDVRLRTDLPHCGDYDWFLRAVRARPFVYVERPLAVLRQHAGQASARHLGRGQDLREARRVVREQVRAHGRDLTLTDALAIGGRRVASSGRRLAAAVRRGRWRQVPELLRHIGAFLRLPMDVVAARRRRTDAPARESV